MDSAVKFIEAIAKLFSAIAWPVAALIILWWFGSAIRSFLASVSEGSLKGFGIEATAKRLAADAIVSGEAKAEGKTVNFGPGIGKSGRLADLLTNSIPLNRVRGRLVVWVGRPPTGEQPAEQPERRALTELGIKVFGASSTQAVLNLATAEAGEVIVVDTRTPEGEALSNEILAKLTDLDISAPCIIYSSTNSPEQEIEARAKGAYGSTNTTADLIILITNALLSQANDPQRRSFRYYT